MAVFDSPNESIWRILGLTSAGQTTMAGSLPVAVASNQSAISVTAGTVMGLTTAGQTTMAGSLPVAIASNQSALSTGVTDGAAAAGQIYPGGVTYQATPSLMADGWLGRIRGTQRRAMITAPDYITFTTTTEIRNTNWTQCFLLSTRDGTYGVAEWARYEWQFTLYNTHDQALSVWIQSYHAAAVDIASAYNTIFAEANALSATTGRARITPYDYGLGTEANNKTCPYLAGVHTDLAIYCSAGSSPSSGHVVVVIEGRTTR